jgi:Protein O-mannosyl-transferase TMEM260-like
MPPKMKATESSSPAGGWWVALGVTAIALAVYGATLAPGLTFEHNGVDGGDLIAAARTLGIPHPSGYPTYTLLAWLTSHLPVGTIAYRVNLLSAICASLAAGLTCRSAQILLTKAQHRLVLSAAVGLMPAFSSLLWSEAVITEVYALLTLFAALLVWLAVSWRQGGGDVRLWLTGLTLGLGLGNHLTLVFIAPALLALLWPERQRWQRARVLIPATSLFLIGASVYVYLPLAAGGQPPVNWGDPQTWERFLWVISGGPYRRYVFALRSGDIAGRIAAWASLLGDQLGWWGLVLALAGAWGWWQDDRPWAICSLVWGLPAGLYAFGYATTDSYVYLSPLLVPLALAWGKGAALLLGLLRSKCPVGAGVSRFRSGWQQVALAVVLMMPLGSLALHWRDADLSGDWTAHNYMQQALDSAASDALIITRADGPTFALWYGVYSEQRRPDVAVVSGPLQAYGWYREQIRKIYPDVAVPEPATSSSTTDDIVRELIAGNLGRRPVYATDPSDAWREWFEFADEGDAPLYRARPKTLGP